MARTRGPLLSLEARGKFGNTVLFQEGKTTSVARMMFKPRNKKTVFQQSNRSNITFGVNVWQTLEWFTKFIWEYVKDKKQFTMSGYNFFLSEYNTSRTAGLPTKLYPDMNLFDNYLIPNGLVAWWRFNEGVGNTITDYISKLVGTTYNATWDVGYIGKALYFNETNAYANCGNPAILNFGTNSFTISARVKRKSQRGSSDVILSKGSLGPVNRGYAMLFYGTSPVGVICDDTLSKSVYFDEMPLNTWVYFTLVINRTTNKMIAYQNGVLTGSVDITGMGSVSSESILWISNQDVYKFNGWIDGFSFYNRALTGAEILHNYNLKE